MKHRILQRRVTLLIYDDNDSVNYISSCQININGKHGTIDSLVGAGFYNWLAEHGFKPFSELGLVEVSAAMTAAHYRLLRTKLAEINTIKITAVTEPSDTDELKLYWIQMKEAA
jgi:hypothetical protein